MSRNIYSVRAGGPRGPRGLASGPLADNSVGEAEIDGSQALQIRQKLEVLGQSELDLRILPSPPLTITAHRGFGRIFPQNTIYAWTMAAPRCDAFETDISVSSDGVLYCFHDETVDDLTDGSGTIVDLPSATIDALRFNSTVGTALEDLSIPRFDRFLQMARRFGKYVYPEIKRIRSQADINLIVGAIQSADMERQCTLSSYSFSDLSYVRGLNQNIGVMYQTSNVAASLGYVDTLAEYGGRTSLLVTLAPLLADLGVARQLALYARSKNVEPVCATLVSQTSLRAVAEAGFTNMYCDVVMEGR
jgi:glycerophosphoryl diester phosphodiesterase